MQEKLNKEKHVPRIQILIGPNHTGANVDSSVAEGLPVIEIPLDQLVGLEPEEKMDIEENKIRMESMAEAILNGKILTPALIRVYKDGYQIIDGHHRFHAYKKAGKNTMPCKVIPEEEIDVIKTDN